MKRVVLFLCTGNYYRSRFAEEWFNHLSQRRRLRWVAESAGLAYHCKTYNRGPVSPHTLLALENARVDLPETPRAPCDVTAEHFQRADRIIALYRAEHRPLLEGRFADVEPRAEYWAFPDVGEMSPTECLPALGRRVGALVDELEAARSSDAPAAQA